MLGNLRLKGIVLAVDSNEQICFHKAFAFHLQNLLFPFVNNLIPHAIVSARKDRHTVHLLSEIGMDAQSLFEQSEQGGSDVRE